MKTILVVAITIVATNGAALAQNFDSQKFLQSVNTMNFHDWGPGQGAQIVGTANGPTGTKLVFFRLRSGQWMQAVCVSLDQPRWLCTIRVLTLE